MQLGKLRHSCNYIVSFSMAVTAYLLICIQECNYLLSLDGIVKLSDSTFVFGVI